MAKLLVTADRGEESGYFKITYTGYTLKQGEKLSAGQSDLGTGTPDSAYDEVVAGLDGHPERVEPLVEMLKQHQWDGESDVYLGTASGAMVAVYTESPTAIKAFGACPILS